ncbi:MAG TPA: plastocyanin/azurin family copper-binding protein [Solirubrobacteraceae bacterium]|nr:plastocyanin/azurin family copper-binding protein [Solirubrobacteraceae bacterium]
MPTRLRPSRALRVLLLLIVVISAVFAATALAATRTVKVQDSFFSAKSVSVSRGTTVTWRWTGALYHNVKVRSGPVRFGSRTQLKGTYSHRFTARGTYKLYCSLHPGMNMTVVVR